MAEEGGFTNRPITHINTGYLIIDRKIYPQKYPQIIFCLAKIPGYSDALLCQ